MEVQAHNFGWLSSLLLNPDCSDVVISVPNDTKEALFPCHSLILIQNSDVFKTMLEKENFMEARTGKITIQGFDHWTVELFLRFLYTGCLSDQITNASLLELIKFSHVYEIHSLLNECSRRCISRPISAADACELHDIAKMFNLEALQGTCREQILNDFHIVLKNDLHFELNKESFSYFIRLYNEQINADQLKAVFRWGAYQCCSKGQEPSAENVRNALPQSCDTFKEALITDGTQFVSHSTHDWIAELYLNPKTCDLEIQIEGDESFKLPVHSFLLINQSDIFLSMYKAAGGDDKDRRLYLNNVSTRVAELMIRYLYTVTLLPEISESNLIGLLKAAHWYNLTQLRDACSVKLIPKISLSNCCMCYRLAKTLDLTDLQTESMKVIKSDFQTVLTSFGYLKLTYDETCSLIVDGKSGTLRPGQVNNYLSYCEKLKFCLNGLRPDVNILTKTHMIKPKSNDEEVNSSKERYCIKRYSGSKIKDLSTENIQLFMLNSQYQFPLFSVKSETEALMTSFKMYVVYNHINQRNRMVFFQSTGSGGSKSIEVSLEHREKRNCERNLNLYSVLVTPFTHIELKENADYYISIAIKPNMALNPPGHVYLPEFRTNSAQLLTDNKGVIASKPVKLLNSVSCVRKVFFQTVCPKPN